MRVVMLHCTRSYVVCIFVLNAAVCCLTFLLLGKQQYNELPRQPAIKQLVALTANEIRYQTNTQHATVSTIYVITPTYSRLVQKAELTRLSTVFKLVGNIHWIVIEDSNHTSPLVSNFLKKSGLTTTSLFTPTPDLQPPNSKVKYKKPRGVMQRNAGLEWLRSNRNSSEYKGVVYFADDDNTYSPELFEEMRDTERVSVWPVGFVGQLKYEAPLVRDGKVVDWRVYWHRKQRKFPTDMAGFAVNLKMILENPDAVFTHKSKVGHLETDFLELLQVNLEDLEPKADLCTKVLVWHTRTEKPDIANENPMEREGHNRSDTAMEV